MNKKVRNNIIIAAIIVLLIIIAAICMYINKINDKDKNSSPDITEVVQNITQVNQNGINLSDIKISTVGSNIIVKFNIQSDSNMSNITATLKLYGGDQKRLRGESSITIDEIMAGSKKEFEISLIGDYNDTDKYEIVIGQ